MKVKNNKMHLEMNENLNLFQTFGKTLIKDIQEYNLQVEEKYF